MQRRLLALFLAAAADACGPQRSAEVATPSAAASLRTDTTQAPTLVPAGFGTLRQDDVALRLDVLSLQVRVFPLDESIIRTLASDSYRALHDLRESQRDQLATIARRTAGTQFSLWYVSYFSAEPGETRFSPMDLVITN